MLCHELSSASVGVFSGPHCLAEEMVPKLFSAQDTMPPWAAMWGVWGLRGGRPCSRAGARHGVQGRGRGARAPRRGTRSVVASLAALAGCLPWARGQTGGPEPEAMLRRLHRARLTLTEALGTSVRGIGGIPSHDARSEGGGARVVPGPPASKTGRGLHPTK